jgi:hypothetical protein
MGRSGIDRKEKTQIYMYITIARQTGWITEGVGEAAGCSVDGMGTGIGKPT